MPCMKLHAKDKYNTVKSMQHYTWTCVDVYWSFNSAKQIYFQTMQAQYCSNPLRTSLLTIRSSALSLILFYSITHQ